MTHEKGLELEFEEGRVGCLGGERISEIPLRNESFCVGRTGKAV